MPRPAPRPDGRGAAGTPRRAALRASMSSSSFPCGAGGPGQLLDPGEPVDPGLAAAVGEGEAGLRLAPRKALGNADIARLLELADMGREVAVGGSDLVAKLGEQSRF